MNQPREEVTVTVRDAGSHPFCMVPMDLIRHPLTNHRHIALYAALRSELDFVKAGVDPSGKVSLRQVVKLLGVDRKTMRGWLRMLEALGWVYVHESDTQGTLIIMHHDPVGKDVERYDKPDRAVGE